MADFPTNRTFLVVSQGLWVAFVSPSLNVYKAIICIWADYSGLFIELLEETGTFRMQCTWFILDFLLKITWIETSKVIYVSKWKSPLCPPLRSGEDELEKINIKLFVQDLYCLCGLPSLPNFKMPQGLRTRDCPCLCSYWVPVFALMTAATEEMQLSSREVDNKSDLLATYQKSTRISCPAPAPCLALKGFLDTILQPFLCLS